MRGSEFGAEPIGGTAIGQDGVIFGISLKNRSFVAATEGRGERSLRFCYPQAEITRGIAQALTAPRSVPTPMA